MIFGYYQREAKSDCRCRYFHGGKSGSTYLNDFWRINKSTFGLSMFGSTKICSDTGVGEQLPSSAVGRANHKMFVYQSHVNPPLGAANESVGIKIFVVGGRNDAGVLASVEMFDVDTMQWDNGCKPSCLACCHQ